MSIDRSFFVFMIKIHTRFVVLLLVPCLIMDPAMAFAVSDVPSINNPSITNTANSSYEQQALMPFLEWVGVTRIYRRITGVTRKQSRKIELGQVPQPTKKTSPPLKEIQRWLKQPSFMSSTVRHLNQETSKERTTHGMKKPGSGLSVLIAEKKEPRMSLYIRRTSAILSPLFLWVFSTPFLELLADCALLPIRIMLKAEILDFELGILHASVAASLIFGILEISVFFPRAATLSGRFAFTFLWSVVTGVKAIIRNQGETNKDDFISGFMGMTLAWTTFAPLLLDGPKITDYAFSFIPSALVTGVGFNMAASVFITLIQYAYTKWINRTRNPPPPATGTTSGTGTSRTAIPEFEEKGNVPLRNQSPHVLSAA